MAIAWESVSHRDDHVEHRVAVSRRANLPIENSIAGIVQREVKLTGPPSEGTEDRVGTAPSGNVAAHVGSDRSDPSRPPRSVIPVRD